MTHHVALDDCGDRLAYVDAFIPSLGWVGDRASARLAGDRVQFPVLVVRNVPTPERVADVLAVRPEAVDLIEWWSEAMRRLSATLERPFPIELSEGPLSRNARISLESAAEAVLDTPVETMSDFETDARAQAFLRADFHGVLADGERDWRLHLVEDANAFRAIADHGIPDRIGVVVLGWAYVFRGNDVDGYPTFAHVSKLPKHARPVVERAAEAACSPFNDYWCLPGYASNAGRAMAVAMGPASASLRLCAMARAGYRRAFVKSRVVKDGTWTVDIEGALTPSEAHARLCRAIGPHRRFPNAGFLVQEHVPFTHEQRFFVVGGRIVASTASDRELCHLDRPSDRVRVFDERVAVVRRPEIAEGAYDRGQTDHVVDRRLSAALARKARTVVAALRNDGVHDYTLDVGLCERGVVPIEMNCLPRSGPYGLDRERLVRAYMARSSPAAIDERIEMARMIAQTLALVSEDKKLVGTAKELVRTLDVADAARPTLDPDSSDPTTLMAQSIVPDGEIVAAAAFEVTVGDGERASGHLYLTIAMDMILPLAVWVQGGEMRAAFVPYGERPGERPVPEVLAALLSGSVAGLDHPKGAGQRWILLNDGRMTTVLDVVPESVGTSLMIRVDQDGETVASLSIERREDLIVRTDATLGADGCIVLRDDDDRHEGDDRTSDLGPNWMTLANKVIGITFAAGAGRVEWTPVDGNDPSGR